MERLFNTYENLPQVAFNIVMHLLKNEEIWKLMKYQDYDCLSKPNLTEDEKINMIWRSQENQHDYNVFLTPLVIDSIDRDNMMLKIYDYKMSPDNQVMATLLMRFEYICVGKATMVEYQGVPCSRLAVMKAMLLKELNGAEVGGVGVMEYNLLMSRWCDAMLDMGNNKNTIGDTLTLAVKAPTTLRENPNG